MGTGYFLSCKIEFISCYGCIKFIDNLIYYFQEGLLDIDIEFSDSMKTPLREIAVSDYHLTVESLDPEVVAFAPMVASHHPRVIAVGEGHGDLLRVTLQLAEACRMSGANSGRRAKGSRTNNNGQGGAQALATATANVEVDFASSDLPHRPEFVQNDGGGMVQGGSSHHHRERKTGREVAPDLHDILIGNYQFIHSFIDSLTYLFIN